MHRPPADPHVHAPRPSRSAGRPRRRAPRLLAAVTALGLAASVAVAAPAPAATGPARSTAAGGDLVPVTASAYALVDAATGTVLAARELHTPRLVASTVKIVTALTASRLIAPDEPVVVSARAAAKPAMKIGMLEGQQWRLYDALASMMMVSANDAAYALAETASGSVEAFAEDMAATGEYLGFADSVFADPAGFDDSFNAEIGPSKMSVYDLAIASRALLADPTLKEIVGTRRYEFVGPERPHTLTNHSRMLRPNTGRYYDGTDGIKTGYTDRARGTFVASATRDGRTLIAVVLGNVDIYTPAQALLDFGFAQPVGGAGIGVTLPPVRDLAAMDRPPMLSPASTVAPAGGDATTATSVVTQDGQVAAPTGQADGDARAADLTGAAASGDEGGSGAGQRVLDAVLVLALAVLGLFVVRGAMARSRERAGIAGAGDPAHEEADEELDADFAAEADRHDHRPDPPALRRLLAFERELLEPEDALSRPRGR